MKTRTPHHRLPLVALSLGLILALPAQAALHDRGGGLIYDDVLEITWLQNANYGASSSYDNGYSTTDGRMTWANAVAWADNLSYYDSVRDVTYSDWRLPTVSPINGSSFQYFSGSDYWSGTRDEGYNVSASGTAYAGATGSELAYMYYNNLGNKGYLNTAGQTQSGYGLVDDANNPNDESLFTNLQSNVYWSGTEYAPNSSNAWFFHTILGSQFADFKDIDYYAMAVHPGDVAAGFT